MATGSDFTTDLAQNSDNDTDYGSEFTAEEEQLVEQLLAGKTDIEDNPIASHFELNDAQQTLRVPRTFGREQRHLLYEAASAAERNAAQLDQIVEYSNLRSRIADSQQGPPTIATIELNLPDTRSPLERFRTEPKKALSVTDLVSPAWCELQYWYTLTIHGRKKRTAAMKQGSIVHQKLEDQVYTTVKVDIESKEDAWGLRIWNVIQGLRTLRETGQTRELEIWGTIDGLVVNGVIDELSYICPNEDMESSIEKKSSKKISQADQPAISDFFKSKKISTTKTITRNHYQGKKIYVCDVKTRGVKSLPADSAFRPTKMQLMLYHNMLGSLAANMIDFRIIIDRYKLDAEKMFSDAFIAQVGNLNDNEYDTPEASQESYQWTQNSMNTLLAHNSLSSLWSLMIAEFQATMPDGINSLGNTLRAEYRSRDTGQILGSKTFPMDTVGLKAYLQREMQWWRGDRPAQGVEIEEAFKCRSCDFADDCEWRLKKVDEAKEKLRLSRKKMVAA